MADKIRITPAELTAQGTVLSGLSSRLEGVRTEIESVGRSAWTCTNGGVGETHTLLANRVRKAAATVKVGANLANEAAQSFTNVDAVIRKHVESGLDNAFTQYMRDTVPDSVMEQPVSRQEVTSPRKQAWDNIKNAEGFREGTFWDGSCGKSEGYTYNSKLRGGSVTIYGSGCAGMARQMQYEMEGRVGDWVAVSTPDEIQVGDVLQYYHLDSAGNVIFENGYPKEHFIYVYDIQGNTIYTGEGNVGGKVVYRTMSKTEFTETGPYDSYRQRLGVVSVNRV